MSCDDCNARVKRQVDEKWELRHAMARQTDRMLRLEAQLAEARAVLEDVEWACVEVYGDQHVVYCPSCSGDKPYEDPDDDWDIAHEGHKPDCRLAAALREDS